MSRVTPVEWWWIFLRFDIWLCWMQLYVKKAHLICLSREPQNVVHLSSRMLHSIVCSLECKLHLIMLCPRLNFLSSMIMELYNCRLGKNVECFSASLSIIFVVKKKAHLNVPPLIRSFLLLSAEALVSILVRSPAHLDTFHRKVFS